VNRPAATRNSIKLATMIRDGERTFHPYELMLSSSSMRRLALRFSMRKMPGYGGAWATTDASLSYAREILAPKLRSDVRARMTPEQIAAVKIRRLERRGVLA